MTNDSRRTAVCPAGGLQVILGALVAAAVANLVVVLFLGGYEANVFGVSIRAHKVTAPLVVLLCLLAARWVAGLTRGGFTASLRSLFPYGTAGAAAGLALFVVVALRQPVAVPLRALATVGALSAAGYFLAWLSYPDELGPRRAYSRAIVFAIFLLLSAGLGDSLGKRDVWSRGFGVPAAERFAGMVSAADRVGLLTGSGVDVAFEKAAVGRDSRNAAVVKPGGFFSTEVAFAPGSTLEFSVAAKGAPSAAKAAVTAVQGSLHKTLWTLDASSLTPDAWTDVRVPVPVEGNAQVVFEVSAAEGAPPVLFANPRIEPPSAPAAPGPNVIVVLVDALRADRLSLYGYSRRTSPDLDRLASGATVFDDCLAQTSWTMPSVATIFTSLYPSAHGVLSPETALSPALGTLAECFQKAGYRTCGVQTNSLVVAEYGMCKGFDEYYSFPLLEPTALTKELYHNAAEVNAKALDWLKSHAGRPFFLYLHYMDVHDPYEPPAEFRVFGKSDSDLYDAEISYMSGEFGRFFDELQKSGILKDTILVLTSDHGEQFLEHGRVKHGVSLYSEETHVPLVFWMPGQAEGRRVAARVGLIDLPVTLLAAAGAAPPPGAAGRSLMPILRGGTIDEAGAFSELTTLYPPGQYIVSLTKGRFRLIVHNPTLGRQSMSLELYDLAADPAERMNLAASNPGMVESMLAEVDSFVSQQKALRAKLAPVPVRVKLDKARQDQLKAIGYLSPQSDQTPGS